MRDRISDRDDVFDVDTACGNLVFGVNGLRLEERWKEH